MSPLKPVETTLEADEVILMADAPKCESGHKAWDNKVCSEEVTHAVHTTCSNDPHWFLVCQAHVDAAFKRFDRGVACQACGELASVCWVIRPA